MSDIDITSFQSTVKSKVDKLNLGTDSYDLYKSLREIEDMCRKEIDSLTKDSNGVSYSSLLQELLTCHVEKEIGVQNPDYRKIIMSPMKYRRYTELLVKVKRNARSKTRAITIDEYRDAIKIAESELGIEIDDKFMV